MRKNIAIARVVDPTTESRQIIGRGARVRDDPVQDFFTQFDSEARAVLDALLDKYAAHGAAQFSIPDALKAPPISECGNVSEIIGCFGGTERLKHAVGELQAMLYAGD